MQGQPVLFGEVLFDSFEDGSRVLGGAPFNVAWHLRGLGLDPLLISRVGKDAEGSQVLDTMRAWDMDVTGIQVDDSHDTGRVMVRLSNGQPDFTIEKPAAWDFISADSAWQVLQSRHSSLLYHGSLAVRESGSLQNLREIRQRLAVPVFVDINLRAPWWEDHITLQLLHKASWVKLNSDELAILGKYTTADAEQFRQNNDIHTLLLTRGEQGACVIDEQGECCDMAQPVENLQDTVGAGDAFSAAYIFGLHQGCSGKTLLQRALRFAAAICERRGATHQDPDLYGGFLQEWC